MTQIEQNNTEKKPVILVYDKDCPLCQAYCRMTRIREAAGELVLVNARDETPILQEITDMGWDVDQGMVLKVDDQLYYGSDAIHALALLSSRSGIFNRLSYWMFKSKKLSAILYPIMRSGRNLLLKILGRSKINNLNLDDNSKF